MPSILAVPDEISLREPARVEGPALGRPPSMTLRSRIQIRPLGGAPGCLFMILFSVIASIVLTVLVNVLAR